MPGLGLLMSSTEVRAQGREGVLGGLAVFGAPVSWAAGSIYARRASLPRSPVLATAMEMIVGGLVLSLVTAVAVLPGWLLAGERLDARARPGRAGHREGREGDARRPGVLGKDTG
jgi:drug/metabolite transporter (DMT)-like permease